MTTSSRVTQSVTQSSFQLSQQPPSYQLLSHNFQDYFLDPSSNISDLSRIGVGFSLGLAPIVVPVMLLSGACNDSSGGFGGNNGVEGEAEGEQDAGLPCVDSDGDGFYAGEGCSKCKTGMDCAEMDCDDNNNAVFPGATEVCDYKDNNCNEETDEGNIQGTFYADRDGDTYGDSNTTSGCNLPIGMLEGGTPVVDRGGDCNDSDATVNPEATEICNVFDDDCDGTIDEDAAPISGAAEICDGLDNNCDGLIDGWQIKYNGSADESDEGHGIALDSDGSNVYVTGFETALDDDEDGNDDGQNIWTRKMDSDGNELWTVPYNDPRNGPDNGLGVVVDSAGDAYVTGLETVAGGTHDIWIRKMGSEDGRDRWTTTYNGPSNGCDEGLGIAMGLSESIYVTGLTFVTGENYNIWLNKYSSEYGEALWAGPVTYTSVSARTDMGLGVAVDSYGNPYVTGFVTDDGGARDIWINKYNSDGIQQSASWPVTYSAPFGDAGANGIVIDLDGEVYVTGSASTALDQNGNVWVNKYGPNGNLLWTEPTTYNGEVNGVDGGSAVALDTSGNIYVAGFETDSEQGFNLWINSYDADERSPLWPAPISYNGSANGDDRGFAIAVDGGGNVYVTGYETVAGQRHDILIQKYLNCPSP